MQLLIAIIIYGIGCVLAKILLCIFHIDKSEHDCWILSWVVIIVLLFIRGK